VDKQSCTLTVVPLVRSLGQKILGLSSSGNMEFTFDTQRLDLKQGVERSQRDARADLKSGQACVTTDREGIGVERLKKINHLSSLPKQPLLEL